MSHSTPRTPPAASASAAFAALHRPGRPLLLPNAWDHASAAILAAHAFPAIGTTSLAVAAADGVTDGAGHTREQTLRLALTLGSEPFLLSVDAEDGFSDDPDEVAEFARELAAAGAVGINLEDGLGPADRHAAKIEAVRAAAPDLFVNARTDTHWLGGGDPDETLSRLMAYQEAGAHGVFVPGITDPEEITRLVRQLDVPLNVLHTPEGPSVQHLAELGVGRVSLGSLLYRRALGAALEAATAVRSGRTPQGTTPSYAEIQRLSSPGASSSG